MDRSVDMIVYGGEEESLDSLKRLSEIQALFLSCERDFCNHDLLSELLIKWRIFESAVADAVCPDRDSNPPLLQRLRQGSLLTGRLFSLSAQRRTTEMPSWLDRLGRVLQDPLFGHLPPKITACVPEGYAYYSLYPETFLESALRFLREVGAPMIWSRR